MINAIGTYIGSRVPGGFDSDASAFFNRVATAGGTLSLTEANAVNQLTIDLKTDGLWTKMKAIYPMVGASASACAQNLKSSSFTGSFSSGWTFESTGATPNGSAFMTTDMSQSANLTPNDNHISVYSRTDWAESSFRADCGTSNNFTHSFSLLVLRYNNQFYFENGNQVPIVTNNNSLGFYLGSGLSSGAKSYKNGSVVGSNTTTQIRSMFVEPIYFGAARLTNGQAAFYSIRENAFASIGNGLTDTEASNFYTRVQAFQTTLSRQV